MKKSSLALIVLPFLLLACDNVNNDLTSNIKSEEESSITSGGDCEDNNCSSLTSSIGDSGENDNDTGSDPSEIVAIEMSIQQVKELGKTYKNKQEETLAKVYVSETYVTIKNLHLLARNTAIAGGKNYPYTHKLLMSDGNDYIYVGCNQITYENLSHDYNLHELYDVTGYISLYNDEIEVFSPSKPVWDGNDQVDWDKKYFNLAEYYEIPEIYDLLENVTLNVKGVGFGKLVKTKVKVISNDIGGKNIYVGKNNDILNIHGDSKFLNKLKKDSTYEIVGALNVFNFRPGLEYICSKVIQEDVMVDFSGILATTYDEMYKNKYEINDKVLNPTQMDYFHMFEHPLKIEGYVNYYLKDSKEYGILEKENNPYYENSYINARDKKALFLANEEYIRQPIGNNSLGDYVDAKIEAIIFPYLWNSQKYPQVYVYNFTII